MSRRQLISGAAAWGLGGLGVSSGPLLASGATGAASAGATQGGGAQTLAAAVRPTDAATGSSSPSAGSSTDPIVSPTAEATATFDAAEYSTTDPASPWVVVNKSHPVTPSDYAPAQLATVAGEKVSAAAAPDLQALLDHSRSDGVSLTLVSGFRTYAYQEQVHRRSVNRQGQAAADRYSARAGFSEHQTGLAVDFSSGTDAGATLAPRFAQTPEGLWLAAHAGEHGWLLRYTEADQSVTGYNPEPWHFRWVGVELCATMAAAGVATLEEFFGVTGGADYPA